MAEITNAYEPARVTPPGGTLQDLLDERGMAQNELAERTGLTAKAINEIVKGKMAITPDTALKLERALGTPAEFWLAREQHFQEWLARQRAREELSGAVAWLRTIPVRLLVAQGFVRACRSQVEQVGELLRFFGVASRDAWEDVYATPQGRFRRSSAFESDVGATAAWLRIGELGAQAVQTSSYQADLFREVLKEAVGLSREPLAATIDKLQNRCASAGVALVCVPGIKGCRASGVTRWLSPSRALIQLSDRHQTEDHFWFTFFHEAGHILLHRKKDVFLEGGGSDTEQEREADRFAQDRLIPPGQYAALRKIAPSGLTALAIQRFAATVGVAPGIVVGRLQHDRLLRFDRLNDLKVSLKLPRS
ncbi:MAG TPA: HigA family addiction module antitoxin [Anaeromyxobacteraceae bacterium]|jgi:addiction module HigA family antidote|nr:HigA family addiction module antitoxin [Anaeromyxobacteraceae bacterium]